MRCVLCIILYIVVNLWGSFTALPIKCGNIQWYKHQCRYQDLINLPLEDPLRQVVEVIVSKLSVNPFSHGSTACADGKRQGTSAESWWQGSGSLKAAVQILYLYIIYIWCHIRFHIINIHDDVELYNYTGYALKDYIYTQRFFLHVEVVCKLERLPFAVAPPRAFASKPNARAHRSSIISGISDFSISQSFSGFSFDLTWPYWIHFGLRNTVETSRGSQAGSSCSADPHPIPKHLSIQQPQITQIDHYATGAMSSDATASFTSDAEDGGTWTTRMGWRVELC